MPWVGKFFSVFVAAIGLLVVGCSENTKVANGTGSEAGETELAAITFTKPNGEPLARGVARFWTMHDDGMNIVDADTLNEKGAVEIEKLMNGFSS